MRSCRRVARLESQVAELKEQQQTPLTVNGLTLAGRLEAPLELKLTSSPMVGESPGHGADYDLGYGRDRCDDLSRRRGESAA